MLNPLEHIGIHSLDLFLFARSSFSRALGSAPLNIQAWRPGVASFEHSCGGKTVPALLCAKVLSYDTQTLHGTAIYADQLGWFWGSMGRHLWHMAVPWSVWDSYFALELRTRNGWVHLEPSTPCFVGGGHVRPTRNQGPGERSPSSNQFRCFLGISPSFYIYLNIRYSDISGLQRRIHPTPRPRPSPTRLDSPRPDAPGSPRPRRRVPGRVRPAHWRKRIGRDARGTGRRRWRDDGARWRLKAWFWGGIQGWEGACGRSRSVLN